MRMTRTLAALGLTSAIALVVTAGLEASDPVGTYCIVKKVVLAPDAEHPNTIQIFGVFAMANGGMQDDGTYVPGWYDEPKPGYLYYTLPVGKEALALKEWKDLQRAAGTGEIVAFGGRYQRMGRLRWADEKPGAPDVYPIQMGVVEIAVTKKNGGDYGTLYAALLKAAGGK